MNSKENLRLLMKRDNTPDSESFSRGDNSRQVQGMGYSTNRSHYSKQCDNSSFMDKSQKIAHNCENEILSNKIKSMLQNLAKNTKEKLNSSSNHSKQFIEQKRNVANIASREPSLNRNNTSQPPFSCFSYHFPKSPKIPLILPPNQQNQQPEINSARQSKKDKPNQNELYYPLTNRSSSDKDRAISSYLNQRKENSQPKNELVKPNYLQYLQDIKKNFDTINKRTIKTPKSQQQSQQQLLSSEAKIKQQPQLIQQTSQQQHQKQIIMSQTTSNFHSKNNKKQNTPSPNLQKSMDNQEAVSQRNESERIPQCFNVMQTQNQQSSTSTNVSEDNYMFCNQNLCLQKEEILFEMQRLSNEKVSSSFMNPYLEKYQKIVIELSKTQNEALLTKIDRNILDSLIYDLIAILIFSVELKKTPQKGRNLEINQKNLIQYLCQSSLFVIEKLLLSPFTTNSVDLHDRMQGRVNERLMSTGRRSGPNNKCSLQKNNDIINSIQQMIIEDSDSQELFSKVMSNLKVDFHQKVNNILIAIKIQVVYISYSKNPQICTKSESELTFVSVVSQEPEYKLNSFPPFLGKIEGKQYTLVLDLDETLVHYQEFEQGGGQFLVRPHAEQFLQEMSKYYELVIFTASLPDYANFILDIIDQKKRISYRLYREHTQLKGNIHLKDLSKLGRCLSKTIIVDNLPENFQLQPENGIFILSWVGDPNDRALKDLTILLTEIVKKKCKDVRSGLKAFRDQMLQRLQSGTKDPYQNLKLEV